MQIEILTLANQLVAAAANGIYQGIIVTVLVALSLRGLGRTNAATRHAVWFCTLLLLVSLLGAHCLIGPPLASETKAAATVPIPGLEVVPLGSTVARDVAAVAGMNSIASAAFRNYLTPGPEPPLEPKPDSLAISSSEAAASEAPRNPIGNRFPQPAIPDGNEPGNVASVSEPLAAANVSGETTRLRSLAERLVNPVSLNLTLGHKVPRAASLMLLAFWLAIAGVRVFVLLLQLCRIRKLKRCSCPPSTGLSELFQRLTSRLAVNRNVELKVSPAHRSSFLLGFLHPVILLPAEERLESGEAELVLRHELAHVRRRDDWANLVQHFILAVFFFHPAVWWISKKLSLEREIACDDHVLQQNGRPQAYALLLANLAARLQRGLPLLAPGSSNNKTQLKQRIDMILNTHRNTSPRLAKTWLAFITSAAALLTVAIICSAPRFVLAQNETAPAAASAPSGDAPAGGIASAAFAPDAPDSDSADTVSPVTPAPAAVGPGPKFKPGNPSALNARPAVQAAPAVPLAPVAAPAVVAPPVPPSPFRLERMVESLMKQQNLRLKSANDGMIDRKESAKLETLARRQAEVSRRQMPDPKEIEKIKEQAEREALRAVDQAKRATAEVERAVKAEQKRPASRKIKEGSQKQLEALQKQLEMLEREREKLDRQIEKLEQEREQLDEQRDEDQAGGDTPPEESKPECVVQPSAPR